MPVQSIAIVHTEIVIIVRPDDGPRTGDAFRRKRQRRFGAGTHKLQKLLIIRIHKLHSQQRHVRHTKTQDGDCRPASESSPAHV